MPTVTTEPLNVRIRPEDRALIDRAAKIRGKNRTQFILDAARDAAAETLMDRSLIQLEPEAFQRFVAALDAPAAPSDQLRRTMSTIPPWES
jgi:uncharacterized protein (DUF1778 family)